MRVTTAQIVEFIKDDSVNVHAYKPDGIGGIVALCADGFIRQFSA